MEFLENNRIKVDPPKKPKKLTATRFATIMNLNAWATPFSAWCEITRTYEKPFADSIYTVAGKIVEPKIGEYLKSCYFMDIKSPTDVYGDDYFKKTWGDFFPAVEGLGGMWDYLGDDFVVEIKTTKRAEDWKGIDGSIEPPIYYKLQAALYAYLLGFDNVVMTCSFLEPDDYPIDLGNGQFDSARTQAFTPTVNNTIVIEFTLSEDFPTFKESYIDPAMDFWNNHVLTGISPEYDEQRDAEILAILRKQTIAPSDTEIQGLIKEGDELKTQIDKANARIAAKEKRLKEIDAAVKKYMIAQFRESDKKVEMKGNTYLWTVTKSVTPTFDSAALKKDNPAIYKKYAGEKPKYTLTKPAISSK